MAVENITYTVPKDTYNYIKNEQYVNMMIREYLSNELSKRLVEILDIEGEIVTKVSDINEELNVYLDAVVFKRQLFHKPLVKCKECAHRDPEDKMCDCGMPERAGCIFPVDDDYFCMYGERRTEDNIEDLDDLGFIKTVYEAFDPYQGDRDRDENGDIY